VFGASAFGSSTTFNSGAFDTQTYSVGGRLQTRPTTATTAATAARRTGSSTQFGTAPVCFVRDAGELAAAIAGANLTSVTPADPAVVRDLVTAETGNDDAKKAAAAERLTDLGRGAVVPLVHLLTAADTPPAQRSAAGRLLARIGSASVLALTPLLEHPSADVRIETIRALSAIGGRVPMDPLTQALADKDAVVRQTAVEALGGLGQPMASIFLAQTLKSDPSPAIRAAAAESLGKTAARAAVEPLVAGLTDPDLGVRQKSARALALMGERLASGTCGQIGRVKAGDALAAALRDRDPTIRATAVDGLGLLRDDRAVDPLAALAGDSSLGPSVIQALGRIGSTSARTALETIAAESPDPAFRRAAAEALEACKKH
jgi:HEAT repeat protein